MVVSESACGGRAADPPACTSTTRRGKREKPTGLVEDWTKDGGVDEHIPPRAPEVNDGPRAGQAVRVAEAAPADRGRAAEHDRGHRAGVEDRAEAAAGYQEVRLGGGASLAPEAEGDHGDEVGDDDGDVHVSLPVHEMDEGRAVGRQGVDRDDGVDTGRGQGLDDGGTAVPHGHFAAITDSSS